MIRFQGMPHPQNKAKAKQRQHVLKDLTTVKVAGITLFILFAYDGFERVMVFDKNMIMRK